MIFGGEEYGTGSSRDWAAKGTQLLGIKAVVARSFERIHRANLVGMGVLPLQFRGADSWESLGLTGDEKIDVVIGGELKPQMDVKIVIHRPDGSAPGSDGAPAHRHADRGRLLQARRASCPSCCGSCWRRSARFRSRARGRLLWAAGAP